MRILHILGGPLASGAGRGAFVLHKALLAAGVDSEIYGRVEAGLPAADRVTPVGLFQRAPVSAMNRLYRSRLRLRFGELPPGFFPLSYGLPLHRTQLYKRADIIHVQWANASTFGLTLWRALQREHRPVVWTLRDMWPFTGGCHFSGTCEKYVSGCGDCPMLGGKSEEMTATDAQFKRRHMPSNVTFVAISEYMATIARRSSILQDMEIRVIPNAVMIPQRRITKEEARRRLGLPLDKFIVGFGAISLSDPRKGSNIFRATVERYGHDPHVHFAVFGQNADRIAVLDSENVTLFGFVQDEEHLQLIYAAADIFLMPSLQESFGKVTAEAMAAGTPVVAFMQTPAEEIAEDNVTGWLVPHGDTAGFLEAIERARSFGGAELAKLGSRARADVLKRFAPRIIAAKHQALYEELITSRFRGADSALWL